MASAAEFDAYRSQQPRLPHGQRGPFSSSVTWPNSPARASPPRTSCPFISRPTPMPSEIVTAIEVADVFGVPPEPELRQRAGVGGVLDHDGQLEPLLEQRPHVHVTPSQVRREDQAPLLVRAAGQAHADAFEEDARMRAAEPAHRPRDRVHPRFRIRGVRHDTCSTNRASIPARPTVVVSGRRSTAMMPARSTLRCRGAGRRPRGRGRSPVTQPSRSARR